MSSMKKINAQIINANHANAHLEKNSQPFLSNKNRQTQYQLEMQKIQHILTDADL